MKLPRHSRIAAFLGALLVLGLSLAALVSGLAVQWWVEAQESVAVLDLPGLSEGAEEPELTAALGAEGEASDPDFREVPVEVEAPPPDIEVETPPPPVVAAPVAGEGNAPDAGAADEEGEGTGAGGGDGTGAGGSGRGSGGGGIPTVSARLVSGEIDDRGIIDPQLAAQRRTDVAQYRFIVLPTGRIFGCRPQRTSGSAALDAHMCNLLERRLRYEPARNAAGKPVADEKAYQQDWRR